MNVKTLLVGFGFSLLALPAAAQTVNLEHFQCYAVLAATPPVDVKVRLEDQFHAIGIILGNDRKPAMVRLRPLQCHRDSGQRSTPDPA